MKPYSDKRVRHIPCRCCDDEPDTRRLGRVRARRKGRRDIDEQLRPPLPQEREPGGVVVAWVIFRP